MLAISFRQQDLISSLLWLLKNVKRKVERNRNVESQGG
jgi:hypothetical protein